MKVESTSFPLEKSRLTLVGRSRRGDGTSFAIPELKWRFDCGALIEGGGGDPLHIFLTHTHDDHITFLTRFQHKDKPPSIHLPFQAVPFVQAFLRAHQALVDMSLSEESLQSVNNTSSSLCKLCPVTPNEEFKIRQKGGDEYVVIPIEAEHRITCYGYRIYRNRKRLKDEYANLPSHEIGKLQKHGVVGLFEEFRESVLCYIGDTTHHVFEYNPQILQEHDLIVTECSYIDDKDLARAEKTKHTHWQHLKPIVEAYPQTMFVLTHFSLKYSALSLLEFFNNQTRQHQNVHPMLVQREIKQQWWNQNDGVPPECQCFRCQQNRVTDDCFGTIVESISSLFSFSESGYKITNLNK